MAHELSEAAWDTMLDINLKGVNMPMNDGLAALEGTTAQAIAERSVGNLLPVP